jgi:hypothetical protein
MVRHATSPGIGGLGRRRPRRRPRPVATEGPSSATALRLERCDIDDDDGIINDLVEPFVAVPHRLVRDLACASCGKRLRGSGNLAKGWKTWRTFALDAIRDELKRNLPVPPNEFQFEMLHIRLGIASDVGSNTMMGDVVLDAHRVDEGGIGLAEDSEGRVESEGLFDDPAIRRCPPTSVGSRCCTYVSASPATSAAIG